MWLNFCFDVKLRVILLHVIMESQGVERESYCGGSFTVQEPWAPELQAYGILEGGGWSQSEDCYNESQESHENSVERVARPVALHAGAWRRTGTSGDLMGGRRSGIARGTNDSEWRGRGRGIASLLSPTLGTSQCP